MTVLSRSKKAAGLPADPRASFPRCSSLDFRGCTASTEEAPGESGAASAMSQEYAHDRHSHFPHGTASTGCGPFLLVVSEGAHSDAVISEERGTTGPARPGVLVVGPSVALRDEVVALAKASVSDRTVVQVLPDDTDGRQVSEFAGLCLVVDACDTPTTPLPRRSGVVLVTQAHDDPDVWRRAHHWTAEEVIVWPQSRAWLAQWLKQSLTSTPTEVSIPPRGRVLAVLPAAGGAGASTLAVAIAQHWASGAVTLLDTDPWGGGLDLVLGADGRPGVSWPELDRIDDTVRAEDVRTALMQHHGVRLLPIRSPWHQPTPAVVARVIEALSTVGDVVVDLPQGMPDLWRAVVPVCDQTILVAPAAVRSVAAARCVLDSGAGQWGRGDRERGATNHRSPFGLGLVVRQPGRGHRGPAPDEIADALGIPLMATWLTEAEVHESVDRGDGIPRDPKSSLAEVVSTIDARLATGSGPPPPRIRRR